MNFHTEEKQPAERLGKEVPERIAIAAFLRAHADDFSKLAQMKEGNGELSGIFRQLSRWARRMARQIGSGEYALKMYHAANALTAEEESALKAVLSAKREALEMIKGTPSRERT